MNEAPGQPAQLKITADQAELRGGWAADDDVGAVSGVLQPIGAQTVAEPQKRLARMLGKFQEARDPAAVTAVALVLDVEKPL